jgi:hypothetical protein
VAHTDPGLHIVSNFSRHARALRRNFDDAFGTPLRASSERFVWDYWNLPSQYTLLRTPPSSVFSAKNLSAFLNELSLWAQTKLGLTTISEPWLSCYVEGCEQRFHTDAAHGPWAFVYSLTPTAFTQKAQGGYTRIAREFSSSSYSRAQEEKDMYCDIESQFNRLVVFDPRRPHAVERVRGVQDVREGRLVIHGWFTDPQPFHGTKMPRSCAKNTLALLELAVGQILSENNFQWEGLGVLRVGRSGRVKWISPLLINTRTARYTSPEELREFLKFLQHRLNKHPKWAPLCRNMGDESLTLPFECESR